MLSTLLRLIGAVNRHRLTAPSDPRTGRRGSARFRHIRTLPKRPDARQPEPVLRGRVSALRSHPLLLREGYRQIQRYPGDDDRDLLRRGPGESCLPRDHGLACVAGAGAAGGGACRSTAALCVDPERGKASAMKNLAPDITRIRLLIEGFYTIEVDEGRVRRIPPGRRPTSRSIGIRRPHHPLARRHQGPPGIRVSTPSSRSSTPAYRSTSGQSRRSFPPSSTPAEGSMKPQPAPILSSSLPQPEVEHGRF